MAMTVILEPRPKVEKDDKSGRHNFDRVKGFDRYEKINRVKPIQELMQSDQLKSS